jgi:hypothetical protein
MSEPYCGILVISGVECHGIIDGNTITLHDQKAGTAWEGHNKNDNQIRSNSSGR